MKRLFSTLALVAFASACAPQPEPPTAILYRTTPDRQRLLTPDTLRAHAGAAEGIERAKVFDDLAADFDGIALGVS